HFAKRIWGKDPTLWKPNAAEQSEITDRLGWLAVSDAVEGSLPRLGGLRDDVRRARLTHCVLVGLGGSHPAPPGARAPFRGATGQPDLIVLDSTDPDTILAVERRIDLPRTLFIVASKSGGTIETLSHFTHFYKLMQDAVGDEAGKRFIAITDAGTKLDQMAQDAKFRAIFRNPADIGGRYSALSYFGLVSPATFGPDVARLLFCALTLRAGPAAR